MRNVAADELAYLTYSGIRNWKPSLRKELAKGGQRITGKIAADTIVRMYYQCEFRVEEGGAALSNTDMIDIIAALIEALSPARKKALASSYKIESDAARRTTALDIAASLGHLWVTRNSPVLGFPYSPLDGKPAVPVYDVTPTADG